MPGPVCCSILGPSWNNKELCDKVAQRCKTKPPVTAAKNITKSLHFWASARSGGCPHPQSLSLTNQLGRMFTPLAGGTPGLEFKAPGIPSSCSHSCPLFPHRPSVLPNFIVRLDLLTRRQLPQRPVQLVTLTGPGGCSNYYAMPISLLRTRRQHT